jgi:hypothetical protein
MATVINYLLTKSFIAGNTTLHYVSGLYKKGDVISIAAYPTDGEPGIALKVDNITYEKFVDADFNWVYKIDFDVTNTGGEAVEFEVYLGIISI